MMDGDKRMQNIFNVENEIVRRNVGQLYGDLQNIHRDNEIIQEITKDR